jgi:tRNA(Ile)-lysidine synthase
VILDNFRVALKNECLLDPKLPLLVGVSGGPDSLCLMDMLNHLGYALTIAYFDHALRPTSQNEANAVLELTRERQLPFVTNRADVALYALQNKESIEEAARNLRYSFLFQEAERLGAQAVVVGHNADDQVETLLMNLIRGSGPAGLGGMQNRALPNAWSKSIPLVRPFLGIWRSEILDYLLANHLQPLMDETNLDYRFMRNRIRHDLLPILENIHPGVRKRLWHTAEIISEEDRWLERLTERAWANCSLIVQDQNISFDRDPFLAQTTGLRRRLIRSGINLLRPGLRDISFDTIKRAIRFIETPTQRANSDLAANLNIIFRGKRIFLLEKESALPEGDFPQIEPYEIIQLIPDSAFGLGKGWQIRLETSQVDQQLLNQISSNADTWQAWLDAERVNQPLILRTRLPGDRIRLLGLKGHSQKISDAMINNHLPKQMRSGWPLLVSDDEIAWLPGVAISNEFAVGSNSKNLLHIKFSKTSV